MTNIFIWAKYSLLKNKHLTSELILSYIHITEPDITEGQAFYCIHINNTTLMYSHHRGDTIQSKEK